MNYDCERPTSRVSKPPGGGSSNIFGGSDANAPTMANKSNNPSYRSSVFSTDPQPENHEVKSKNECTEDGQCKECRQLGETLCSNLSLVDKKEASCLKENGAEGEGKDEAKGVIVGSPKKTNTYSSSVFETPEIPEARHPVLRKYTSSLVYGEENRCREQIKDSNNCSSIRAVEDDIYCIEAGTNQRRLSNIPMFDTDKRPTSAPALSTRGCGKISRSSVFMHSNYPEDPSTQPGLVTRPNTVRRDPITGNIINGKEEQEKKNKVEEPKTEEKSDEKTEEKEKVKRETAENDPHLGPVRNMSGVRCAQPPGGRSTFTLG